MVISSINQSMSIEFEQFFNFFFMKDAINFFFFKILNIPTMSWWMAENGPSKVGFSFIELGAEKVSQEQVRFGKVRLG